MKSELSSVRIVYVERLSAVQLVNDTQHLTFFAPLDVPAACQIQPLVSVNYCIPVISFVSVYVVGVLFTSCVSVSIISIIIKCF